MGQPFGYRPDAPNQKHGLSKRQLKWAVWREKHRTEGEPQWVFDNVTGSDLIEASRAVSLSEIYHRIEKNGRDETIAHLKKLGDVEPARFERLVDALANVLQSKVIIQLVSPEIVANQEEYVRLFGRLGQGGTRLTDDELTYSIKKSQYPRIHNRIN